MRKVHGVGQCPMLQAAQEQVDEEVDAQEVGCHRQTRHRVLPQDAHRRGSTCVDEPVGGRRDDWNRPERETSRDLQQCI